MIRAVHRRGRREETGAVTAEAALAIPLLAAVTVGLVWMLAVAAAQIRTVDAAREAARMAARGDSHASAAAVARRIAPAGARVHLTEDGAEIRVRVTARVAPPGGVFSRSGIVVDSTSVAAREKTGVLAE